MSRLKDAVLLSVTFPQMFCIVCVSRHECVFDVLHTLQTGNFQTLFFLDFLRILFQRLAISSRLSAEHKRKKNDSELMLEKKLFMLQLLLYLMLLLW